MKRIENLYTSKHLANRTILIPELNILYGGNLYFPANRSNNKRPYIFANFVQSVDGIVSYNIKNKNDSSYISRNNKQDRFIVALLRSLSDAVIIGENTFNIETKHIWTSDYICPEYKDLFINQRKLLNKKMDPYNIFVTADGNLDLGGLVFRKSNIDKIIVTTPRGKKRLLERNNFLGRLRNVHVIVLPCNKDNNIDLSKLVKVLKLKFNINYLLVEGGPCLFGSFEKSSLINELFVTISPIIVGNSYKKYRQTIIMSDSGYTPERSHFTDLLSIKKYNNYIFVHRKL